MRNREVVDRVLELYPRIFHACHSRHVRDPKTREAVSTHQARVLDHLDDVEPTSLMDLARHMGVGASTMSLTVDRLVRRGYVTRSRDAADRRVVSLRLTDAGARLRDAQSVLDPMRVKLMIMRLSPEDRRDAVNGLALLARAANEEMHNRSSKTARLRKQESRSPDRRTRK
ncbi:MAG TPA: MarR family transcriptional regulator [Blastocatellia bacterium]|nr:MarR family transcriptional regulator [Blastocatellia bacterium]